jgi:hypothetical protein
MKLLVVLSLLCLLALAVAKPDYEKKFKQFQKKFGKDYKGNPKNMEKAMARYQKKLDKIEAHNERFKKGEEDYEMGEYEFDDEDPDEVIVQRAGAKPPEGPFSNTTPPCTTTKASASKTTTAKPQNQPVANATVDWRSLMFPVIDQKVSTFDRIE